MPFKSIAQATMMKHKKPDLYKEFADKTPKGTPLPFKIGALTPTQKKKKRPKKPIPWPGPAAKSGR